MYRRYLLLPTLLLASSVLSCQTTAPMSPSLPTATTSTQPVNKSPLRAHTPSSGTSTVKKEVAYVSWRVVVDALIWSLSNEDKLLFFLLYVIGTLSKLMSHYFFRW